MRVPSRVGWVLWGCLVGCAGTTAPTQAPQPEPAPATQAEPPGAPRTETQDHGDIPASAAPVERHDALEGQNELAEAERSLAEADRKLEGLAQGPKASEDAETAVPERRGQTRQQRCQTTCQAFSSLERARDAICRIDGEQGDRCARASAIVKRHTASRDSCGCGN